MSKWFNVNWKRDIRFECSVSVEANSEEEAIEKVKNGDVFPSETIEDSVIDDYQFSANEQESDGEFV